MIDFAKMQGKLKGTPAAKKQAQQKPPKLPEPKKRQIMLRTRLEELLELDASQLSGEAD